MKLNRELSRRQTSNPITALKEWSDAHPKRNVSYEFVKWEEIGEWVCIAEAKDEKGREYTVVGTHRFCQGAKRDLKWGVALDLYLEIH